MWSGKKWPDDSTTIIESDTADIGWTYLGKSFIEPEQSVRDKTDDEKLLTLKIEVQAALHFTDRVALRAFKAGIPFGDEWCAYDSALRELMSVTEWSDDLVLPVQPANYPA